MKSPLDLLGIAERPTLLGNQFKEQWEGALEAVHTRLTKHGDFADRCRVVEALSTPETTGRFINQDVPTVRLKGPKANELTQALRALGPWKKGPFRFHAEDRTVELDAEWRSDLKWRRLLMMGVEFDGRSVLDVGTGNGYFLYRLASAGARLVLGLEPGVLSVCQYLLLQRLFQMKSCALMPVTSSEFVQSCQAFDVVLSMGVLYHRRSPLDHLAELRGFLRPGGTLVLETIAHPGTLGFSLVPEGRYAQMRNVFFLPSPDTLVSWLKKIGFLRIECSEPLITSVHEQRRTQWMPNPSLNEFLEPSWNDPDDLERPTVEGYVRPHRMFVTARTPNP